MMVHLRAATVHDALATGQILDDFIQSTPWMPKLHTLRETVGFCTTMITRGWVSVAVSDGVVAGFLSKNQAFIHALYIAPHARGMGLGHRLLRQAQMQENNLDLWTFQANTAAQRFYQREGFYEVERTGGHGNDEKLPDVRYQWHRTQHEETQ